MFYTSARWLDICTATMSTHQGRDSMRLSIIPLACTALPPPPTCSMGALKRDKVTRCTLLLIIACCCQLLLLAALVTAVLPGLPMHRSSSTHQPTMICDGATRWCSSCIVLWCTMSTATCGYNTQQRPTECWMC